MGFELAWWMRIHRHVLSVFPVVWIEVQGDPKLRGTSFPQHCRIQFFPKPCSRNPRFLLADVCPKNFTTSSIFSFHLLPPLAFVFRFPRPKTARFPSISHGPSNSPSCGSAGGFRLPTIPCTEIYNYHVLRGSGYLVTDYM